MTVVVVAAATQRIRRLAAPAHMDTTEVTVLGAGRAAAAAEPVRKGSRVREAAGVEKAVRAKQAP
jgi:hypothetical protein